MNASRTDDMVLDKPDLVRAIDLLERTEKKMPRAFGGIGLSQNAQLTYAISELIAHSPNGVTVSEIMRAHTFNGTTSDISDALDILVQSKMVRIDQTNNGPLYKINN